MTTFVYDARFAHPKRLDGVGRFVWCTFRALGAALRADESVVVICHDDDADSYRAHLRPSDRLVPTDMPIASLAQHATWPRLIESLRPNLVFYPQYDMPRVPDGVTAVASVYDLTPLDEGDYFGRGRSWRALAAAGLLGSTCSRAAVVTTLSRASAGLLAERVLSVRSRLRVIKPGPSLLPRSSQACSATPLFVYVGNHRPHKRIDVLLGAFSRVRKRLPFASLVLVGRSDPRFPQVGNLVRGPLGAGVSIIDNADDTAVAGWLAAATALVFASRGEGFGFPVTEAFGQGTPAVVADAGSLPEVVDGGGLIVAPPDDETAWADAMTEIAVNVGLRTSCAARAREVAAGLSWQSSAAQLVTIWRSALNLTLPQSQERQ